MGLVTFPIPIPISFPFSLSVSLSLAVLVLDLDPRIPLSPPGRLDRLIRVCMPICVRGY